MCRVCRWVHPLVEHSSRYSGHNSTPKTKEKGYGMEYLMANSTPADDVQINIPDAIHLVAVEGDTAKRLSDLSLYQSDLNFGIEALNLLEKLAESEKIHREALWRVAILHYMKCFGGQRVRFALEPLTIYRDSPPEAMESFNYFKTLRNKHFVHDENSYSQSIPGAALNDGSKAYKVEKIVCFAARAETLVSANYGNLYSLLIEALNWVNKEFDKQCNALTAELEKLSYKDLKEMRSLQYVPPSLEDLSKARKKPNGL